VRDRLAPDRPDQAVEGTQHASILNAELEQPRATALQCRRHRVDGDGYALIAHDVHQSVAQHGIELPQNTLVPQDYARIRAERAEDAGELGRDIAAADDGNALRSRLELKKTVRGQAQRRAGQRGHDRGAASGQHDRAGRDQSRANLHRLRRAQPRMLAQQFDLAALEVALVKRVEPRHELVALALELRPVVRRDADLEAVVGRIMQRMGDLTGIPHDLFGHAAHIYAGAAEPVTLDHQRARAVFGGALRTGQATAAAADHNQVVFRCHAGKPRRPKCAARFDHVTPRARR
jgi:hypothetical protein